MKKKVRKTHKNHTVLWVWWASLFLSAYSLFHLLLVTEIQFSFREPLFLYSQSCDIQMGFCQSWLQKWSCDSDPANRTPTFFVLCDWFRISQ